MNRRTMLIGGVGGQRAGEQIIDHEQVRGFHLRTIFSDRAELARFVDVLDQHMRLAIEHLVAALYGQVRECLGGVALAHPGRPHPGTAARGRCRGGGAGAAPRRRF